MNSQYPPLFLKKQEQRRLVAGHLWIYSNEVDTSKTPLSSFTPGQLVEIFDFKNNSFGIAYINPHSLIVARLLTRKQNTRIDETWFSKQINTALNWRQHHYAKPFYRLIYGESDFLPGLIVDRYDDTLVLQMNTVGMQTQQELILNALEDLIKPARIVLKNDSSMRELEGLPRHIEILKGDAEKPLYIEENNVSFHAPLTSGQKTGWFYDHRQNRFFLKDFVKDKKILDVFSYLGGWGIQTAVFGAKTVTCIDSSNEALSWLEKNAKLNHVEQKINALCGDAFNELSDLNRQREQFDVVIVDPPAFIKRKKDIATGQEAYCRINELALKLLAKDGLLVSASCSSFLSQDELINLIRKASLRAKRQTTIITQGSQAMDHPIHPAMNETAYLKALFVRIQL